MFTTRRDIKLSFSRPKYEKNGNVVKCTLDYIIDVPATFAAKNDPTLMAEVVLSFPQQSAVGTAVCTEGDEFNKKIGREIAEARAEAHAYKHAEILLKKTLKGMIDSYGDYLTAFTYKAEAVRRHNRQFVSGLAGTEETEEKY